MLCAAVYVGLVWHVPQLAVHRGDAAVAEHALVHPAAAVDLWARLCSGLRPPYLTLITTHKRLQYAHLGFRATQGLGCPVLAYPCHNPRTPRMPAVGHLGLRAA